MRDNDKQKVNGHCLISGDMKSVQLKFKEIKEKVMGGFNMVGLVMRLYYRVP